MEALWQGDRGTIDRTLDTRKRGGTDLTTCTFLSYYLFLSRILPAAQVTSHLQRNATAQRVYEDFKGRIGYRGAVGLRARDGVVPEVRVRHTLMGLITLLFYGKASGDNITEDLLSPSSYLIKNLPLWRDDQSHLYAMAGAAVKLQEMLSQDIGLQQLTSEQLVGLRDALAVAIPHMMAGTNTIPVV